MHFLKLGCKSPHHLFHHGQQALAHLAKGKIFFEALKSPQCLHIRTRLNKSTNPYLRNPSIHVKSIQTIVFRTHHFAMNLHRSRQHLVGLLHQSCQNHLGLIRMRRIRGAFEKFFNLAHSALILLHSEQIRRRHMLGDFLKGIRNHRHPLDIEHTVFGDQPLIPDASRNLNLHPVVSRIFCKHQTFELLARFHHEHISHEAPRAKQTNQEKGKSAIHADTGK